MKPVSIFIMDVTKSSSSDNGEELSKYLEDIEVLINHWFEGYGSVKVKHRSGDEVIFLSYGYSAAFVTAFFISRIWRYEENKPYFGLAFGNVDKELEELDIDKWIHPLVKQARMANDCLKDQRERETFLFKGHDHAPELLTLLNGMLKLQHVVNGHQTEIQRLVCSLYLVYERQNAVAEILKRSAPTIYSHYKKGNSEHLFRSYREMAGVLDSLQTKEFGGLVNNNADLLEEKIRMELKERAREIFNL